MSKSSPSDLATAFRSFPRRLGEGLAAVDDDPSIRRTADGLAVRVRGAITAAAAALGLSGDVDEPTTVALISEKLTTTDPERWDEAVLDEIRRLALEAGAALRSLGELAP